MNQGIYGLGGQIVTPVQGPFSGVADARKLFQSRVLVCAGGAGGGPTSAGRAGTGSGGGGVIETAFAAQLGTSYTVSVGAGSGIGNPAPVGSPSRFGPLTAVGGGGGTTGVPTLGGTSPGTFATTRFQPVIATQGFSGGIGLSAFTVSGGGGGAGGQGVDATSTACGAGGIGYGSEITGTLFFYGGGGGAGSYTTATPNATAGAGGLSGGGSGGNSATATAGAANSGGGGGGAPSTGGTAASGGSGVVILRWDASQAVATLSAGLTFTRSTIGTDTVIRITAGTGTVTWS